jgi:hypothetical protein
MAVPFSQLPLQMRRGGWAAAALLLIAAPEVARADDQSSQTSTPQRPAIMFNRWQEVGARGPARPT